MASNLPEGFQDPADDEDIHEFAEMPFIDEIINDESFMDKYFIPDEADAYDLIVALNSQECIDPQWKIDYYKSEEERKSESKLHQKVKEIYGGTPLMREMFNEFIKDINNWKI